MNSNYSAAVVPLQMEQRNRRTSFSTRQLHNNNLYWKRHSQNVFHIHEMCVFAHGSPFRKKKENKTKNLERTRRPCVLRTIQQILNGLTIDHRFHLII